VIDTSFVERAIARGARRLYQRHLDKEFAHVVGMAFTSGITKSTGLSAEQIIELARSLIRRPRPGRPTVSSPV
jgi:hypothetical protein